MLFNTLLLFSIKILAALPVSTDRPTTIALIDNENDHPDVDVSVDGEVSADTFTRAETNFNIAKIAKMIARNDQKYSSTIANSTNHHGLNTFIQSSKKL